MDNQQQQQAIDRVKQANNVLVTVSNNPSVDQLAACIGLTVALNKMGKHATAVFSGAVPDTIEFLQPEKTLESNTDSLRDFIIALDKSKADKLRYKVEDKVVKIFITPYRTSIGQDDLVFSQGDFNVDVVLALGVHVQTELDQAITAHGRILHDAAVISVNTKSGGELGTVNWVESQASSLSELATLLVNGIDKSVVDGQIATAFLTGIVSETKRFSNEKTSPRTMSVSAELMTAGANQQLVATKLEPKAPPAPPPAPPSAAPQPAAPLQIQGKAAAPEAKEEGTLEISHAPKPMSSLEDLSASNSYEQESPESNVPQINIDREGVLRRLEEVQKAEEAATHSPGQGSESHVQGTERIISQPPSLASPASAIGTAGGGAFGSADPLVQPPSAQSHGPILTRKPLPFQEPEQQADDEQPSNSPNSQPSAADSAMLSHGAPGQAQPDPTTARQAVQAAPSNEPLKPLQRLNAMPLPPIDHSSQPQPAQFHGIKVIEPPNSTGPEQSSQSPSVPAPPPTPPPMVPPPQA